MRAADTPNKHDADHSENFAAHEGAPGCRSGPGFAFCMQSRMSIHSQRDLPLAPFNGPVGGKNPVCGLLRNMTRHCLPDARGLAPRWCPQDASQALQTGLLQAEVRTATADRPLCMSRAAWNWLHVATGLRDGT